ncbi:MAG: hypothetical protein EZS28_000537 [Streblomastix strix]|uniref:Uncharacterized protein n=1 Tax=Streblomastix strix TaxID=222440 RepID=A0A5J4X9U0_9EUKA|nr:MAG: hypothetical protein EZS28_000537 [Streblomastix strix]
MQALEKVVTNANRLCVHNAKQIVRFAIKIFAHDAQTMELNVMDARIRSAKNASRIAKLAHRDVVLNVYLQNLNVIHVKTLCVRFAQDNVKDVIKIFAKDVYQKEFNVMDVRNRSVKNVSIIVKYVRSYGAKTVLILNLNATNARNAIRYFAMIVYPKEQHALVIQKFVKHASNNAIFVRRDSAIIATIIGLNARFVRNGHAKIASRNVLNAMRMFVNIVFLVVQCVQHATNKCVLDAQNNAMLVHRSGVQIMQTLDKLVSFVPN